MTDPRATSDIEGTEAGGPSTARRAIDTVGVSKWFGANVAGVVSPLRFRLIAGGRSNLTFEVTDGAGKRYVLRRPPVGHILPTAHDMAREHRIISAMAPAGVPVAPALGLCTDEAVTGAAFYVTGFVEGLVPRSEEEATAGLEEQARHRAGLDLMDILARIHGLDADAVGLGDLGRKEGYVARQLKRWYAQYQASRDTQGAPAVPDIDEVHDALSGRVPPQGPAAVVHGDYRLDNCVLAPDGRVRAVLDWELCTLGDPLADLGQLLAYWPEPGERSALGHTATTAPGFPCRDELVARYQAATGRDFGRLDFYVAFAYWKLACILEGVYARYAGGAMGDDDFDFSSYPDTISWLATRAKDATAGLA